MSPTHLTVEQTRSETKKPKEEQDGHLHDSHNLEALLALALGGDVRLEVPYGSSHRKHSLLIAYSMFKK